MSKTPTHSSTKSPEGTTLIFLVLLHTIAYEFSSFPIVVYIRKIKYQECVQHTSPSMKDSCDTERHYGPVLLQYFGIISLLSVLFSGPFSRVMDVKGRQFALITSGIINLVGELWLHFCGMSVLTFICNVVRF